ncbi:MAG: hypothetical protein ACM3UZ_09600 [Acidobacteriota bacterium]
MLEDPFEGHISKPTVEHIYEIAEKENTHPWHGLYRIARERVRVNCWHINNHQSMAMWKIYSSKGIAIKSNFKRLCRAFDETDIPVFIGKVQYYDHTRDSLPNLRQMLLPVLYKGKAYEYENELRAIAMKKYNIGLDEFEYDPKVPIILDILIEDVFLSPFAPDWLTKTVGNLIERIGLNLKPKQSDLLIKPNS